MGQASVFMPARAVILTVSDTRTLQNDTSGAYLEQALAAAGHELIDRTIVTDDIEKIRAAVERALAASPDLILVTGGTGLAARDVTPEALLPFFQRSIPGFGELFRFLSYAEIGAATIQSRATAGLYERTLIFALPGSTGACRLAMEKIILPQIDPQQKPCNFRTVLQPVSSLGE